MRLIMQTDNGQGKGRNIEKRLAYLYLPMWAVIATWISLPATLQAQTPAPIAYFSFDEWPVVDKSGNNSKIFFDQNFDSTLHCGARNNAIRLNGINSEIYFLSPSVFDNFRTGDFSLSFYFKPSNAGYGELDIFSKRRACTQDSSFAIKYIPSANQLKIECTETSRKQASFTARLPYGRCWQHIVIVRAYNKVSLYVNGKYLDSRTTNNRVALNNDQPLVVAKSPCLATTDKKFTGFLDEIGIYPTALTEEQIGNLYYSPDRIANRDTIIFLGNSIDANITSTCATQFHWTPSIDVSDSTSFRPIITPTAGGEFTYFLRFKEPQCTSLDSFHVRVIDPRNLNCEKLYIPNAFTPNGDALNETFYISNPDALVDGFLYLEILDAWGARIFYTEDKKEGWDGTFNGQKVNPGVYLWKARFKCKGKEISDAGSVTVLR
jgi:gliding motility-associated-like protein